ncbi:hypothetical protein ACE40V_24415, partial [Salmonella enterica]|uniref:hypothetical protein n=1 Tax=Salmonella enterica TaxID=28901 RepID=UPI003D2846FB
PLEVNDAKKFRYDYENDIIDRLEIDLVKRKLSPTQLEILQYWGEEGHTMSETARLLNMPINEVRLNVKAIRTTFVQSGVEFV